MLTENQYNKLEANTNVAGIEDSVWDVYLIDEQSKETAKKFLNFVV